MKYFNKSGECTETDKPLAKLDGSTSYLLVCVTPGSTAGTLFNPDDVGFKQNRDEYKWKLAPHDSFNAYLTFLETGNSAYLRVAQRRLYAS